MYLCKEHDYVLLNNYCYTCRVCGLEGDKVFKAVVPNYGNQPYSRRFKPYSRTARFAEKLDTVPLEREDFRKIMGYFYPLLSAWKAWDEKTSRYFFSRKVVVSYFVSKHFKIKRPRMLKNTVSENRQIEQIIFLLTEFEPKKYVPEKTLWDLFDEKH